MENLHILATMLWVLTAASLVEFNHHFLPLAFSFRRSLGRQNNLDNHNESYTMFITFGIRLFQNGLALKQPLHLNDDWLNRTFPHADTQGQNRYSHVQQESRWLHFIKCNCTWQEKGAACFAL